MSTIIPPLPLLPFPPFSPAAVPAVVNAGTNLQAGKSNKQAYIYTFGDSYSTTGYNSHDIIGQPTILNHLGNPAYPGYTTAGTGLGNWVDKLTYNHQPAGYTTFTYNYAVAAALVKFSRYPYSTNVTDFIGQTSNFLTAGTRPKFKPQQAVAVPYWGTNDIFAHSASPYGDALDNGVITATMNDYWAEMEDIYAAGVRNFVVLLADPLERTPFVLTITHPPKIVQTVATNRAEWNAQLKSRVLSFRASHADAKVATVDTGPIFNTILDNPQAHGAPDNMCSNKDGTSCLWWDKLHPGQAIHTAIANGVAAALARIGFYPS